MALFVWHIKIYLLKYEYKEVEQMKGKIKRLTFELDEEVFYKLKCYCAENKITFKDLLTEFIKDKVK